MKIFGAAVLALSTIQSSEAFSGRQFSRPVSQLNQHKSGDGFPSLAGTVASAVVGLTVASQGATAVEPVQQPVPIEVNQAAPALQEVQISSESAISENSLYLSAFGGGDDFMDFSLPSYGSAVNENAATSKPAQAKSDFLANPFGDFDFGVSRDKEDTAAPAVGTSEEVDKKAEDKTAQEAERKAEREAAEAAKKAEKEAAEAKKAEEAAAKAAEKEARRAAEKEKQRLAVERAKEEKAKEAVVPAPEAKSEVANFDFPEFKVPDVKLDIPEVKIPEFKAPDVKLPSFSAPKFSMPKIDMPDMSKVDMPTTSSFDKPKVEMPSVPSFSSFDVPKVTLPKFDSGSSSAESEDLEPQEVRDERARVARAAFAEADETAKEVEKKAAELRQIANDKKKLAKAAKDEACKTRIGGKLLCIRGFNSGF